MDCRFWHDYLGTISRGINQLIRNTVNFYQLTCGTRSWEMYWRDCACGQDKNVWLCLISHLELLKPINQLRWRCCQSSINRVQPSDLPFLAQIVLTRPCWLIAYKSQYWIICLWSAKCNRHALIKHKLNLVDSKKLFH